MSVVNSLKRFAFVGIAVVATLYAAALSDTESSEENKRRSSSSFSVGLAVFPNLVRHTAEGGYEGYILDILHHIEKSENIKFDIRYYPSRQALIEAAKKGEIELFPAATDTASRLKDFHASLPLLGLHRRIAVRLNDTEAPTLKTLFMAEVAVVSGSSLERYLKEHFRGIRIRPVTDGNAALRSVAEGKTQAAVVEAVCAGYYLRYGNYTNIGIGEDLGVDYKLAFIVSDRAPSLRTRINRAIEALSPEARRALEAKWSYLGEAGSTLPDVRTIALFLLLVGFIGMGGFYLYITNNRLQNEINAHKRTLDKLNAVLEKQRHIEANLEERIAEEVERNKQQQLFIMHQNRLAIMGELISMIAHQWRQPLHALAALIQVHVIKYHRGELDENEVEKFKKNTALQIDNMSKTINDFRDFFRPSHKRETFSVNATINETVQLVKPMFSEHKIDLEVHMPETIMIRNFSHSLSQALLNIINNAKDAIVEKRPQKRKVTVTLSRTAENKALITIEDTAGGIDEAIADKIFDPYFSTKDEKHGTGLGLYMAKKIIEEQMDGLLLFSNETEGAKFAVLLRNIGVSDEEHLSNENERGTEIEDE
jgi:signal transduction histidine kinase